MRYSKLQTGFGKTKCVPFWSKCLFFPNLNIFIKTRPSDGFNSTNINLSVSTNFWLFLMIRFICTVLLSNFLSFSLFPALLRNRTNQGTGIITEFSLLLWNFIDTDVKDNQLTAGPLLEVWNPYQLSDHQ